MKITVLKDCYMNCFKVVMERRTRKRRERKKWIQKK
jgi:hypothetical protein